MADQILTLNGKQAAAGSGVINLIPPDFISGLKMIWNSATSLSVTTGAACRPSDSLLMMPAALITKAGLVLTASTWYHLYLYMNGANPDVEIVTTAPAAAYVGTARAKTGDTSRRYIGSILTDASGNVYKFQQSEKIIDWLETVNLSPFTVSIGFAATVPTDISCSGAVPVTGVSAKFRYDNNSQQQLAFSNSSCNFTLSSSTWLHLTSALPASFTERLMFSLPLDANQAFQAMYVAPPSSTAAFRVMGYTFER